MKAQTLEQLSSSEIPRRLLRAARLGHAMVRLLLPILFIFPAWGSDQAPQQNPTDRGLENSTKPCVVVEKILHQSEGEKAGLQEGDILLTWSRGDSEGEIQSPFDLAEIEIEQAPLGIVKLEGLRGTKKQAWSLGPSSWGLTGRPNFRGDLLITYRDSEELVKAGKATEVLKASKRWEELARRYPGSQTTWVLPWLFFHAAELLRDAKQWQEADDAYQSAVHDATGTGPVIEGQLLQAWAKAYQQRNDWVNAEKYFQRAIEKIEGSGEGKLAIASSLDDLGSIARERGDLNRAEQYHRQALDVREKLAPGSLAVAASLANLGTIAFQRGDLAKAEAYYRQALSMRERLAPGSLDVAASFNNLGVLAWRRGDFIEAQEYYDQALELREKLAPASLLVAASFNNLGILTSQQGDLTKAEQYHRQALEIRQRLAPETLDVAASLNGLSNVAYDQGDLATAEEYDRRTLEIREKLAPGSLVVATSFTNLGNVAYERGNLTKAEQYHHQALDIQQKLAPASLDVATSFINLGNVAGERGDLVKAEEYNRQALDIRENLAPQSIDVAASLSNLGVLASQRGDLAKAEQYHRQALDIRQRLAPASLHVAASLANLGDVANDRGDQVKAEEYYHQGLAIEEKLAPGSLDMASIVQNLGNLFRKSRDLEKAEQYYRQALAIREHLAPESTEHAESLAAVASILRDQQRLGTAEQFYAKAVSALESQTTRLGGSEEVRSGFRANHSDIYRDYVDLLLAQKQPGRALEMLERSRARILLEMLSSTRVDIRKGADPSLLKQERSLQESLTAKSDRRLRLLEERNNEKQLAAFSHEIEDLEKQYQEVEERLRRNSPSYTALTQPQPLTASGIQQLLDSNTLLLEYSLGNERSYVFAITPDSLTTHELPKRPEIESKAKHLYELLTARNRSVKGEKAEIRQQRVTKSDAYYLAAASALSRILLGPLAADFGRKRLVIVGDGALLYIPFATLPIPQGTRRSSSGRRYEPLIAEHEIVELPSASVLAALRGERASRQQASRQVVVLADPVFDARDIRVRHASGVRAAAEVTSGAANEGISPFSRTSGSDSARLLTRSLADVDLGRDGTLHLPRLAFTRDEAAAILEATPSGMARVAIDFDANRQLAVSGELARYRIVHFATHALVDNIHPELSGLVLSLVDKNGMPLDGLLDLEDIYNLDLSADLVVLSACQTALGKEVNGEGLIGLTRGFMHAGAPRVISTLWKVNDFTTAKLMARFYKAMKQDAMKPAQALRQAQLALWREQSWSAPYYWAGFLIQGDWQ